jgi:hypothetical protein
MRAVAARSAAEIVDEKTHWASPYATLIDAALAYQTGDNGAAAHALTRAVDQFTAADMPLHAAACQRQLGAIVGGDDGAALRMNGQDFMARQGIRNPAAFSRVLTPGFAD